jgi:uncharacterized protein (DUF4415 family)
MPQTIKTHSGRLLVLPTGEEDAQINAGIASDPDTFEPTDEQLALFKPAKPGRPFAEQNKERITIRLSPEVVAAFRASGAGWQTRIDAILKEWLNHHRI